MVIADLAEFIDDSFDAPPDVEQPVLAGGIDIGGTDSGDLISTILGVATQLPSIISSWETRDEKAKNDLLIQQMQAQAEIDAKLKAQNQISLFIIGGLAAVVLIILLTRKRN